MPASIAHMLISQQVRNDLRNDDKVTDSDKLKEFLRIVLDKYPAFMELGSLGPDLPYFGSLLKALWTTVIYKVDKPMDFDRWSYQLHSKDTNIFPLRLIEVTRKEANPNTVDWDETDRMKFAFLCGFLTHVAADQIIHPLVNAIAGSYYKRILSRDEHRTCEIYQDLYVLAKLQHNGRLLRSDFVETSFDEWCRTKPDELWSSRAVWFRYFIRKAFVEAHAVCPEEKEITRWIKGIRKTLKYVIHGHFPLRSLRPFLPYEQACKALFDKQGNIKTGTTPYSKYIALEPLNNGNTYDTYLSEAIELAKIYVRAAFKLYDADEIDTLQRGRFSLVVQPADLGAPLDKDILRTASEALSHWDILHP